VHNQNLTKRFIELAEETLSAYPGRHLDEKMAAWCLSVLINLFSDVSPTELETKAKQRALLLKYKIIKWLDDNGKDRDNPLIARELEVHLGETSMRVGDRQLGYIEADTKTGLALTDKSVRYTPILPTYISLYKYVTVKAFKCMRENGLLKASEPMECNDVYEFTPAWRNEEEKRAIFEIRQSFEMVMFCLSRTPTSSVMWGHYAENGKGALLHFRVPVYKLIAGENEHECLLVIAKNEKDLSRKVQNKSALFISQVTYADERPVYEPKKTYYSYDQIYSRKGSDWDYEQEMRIYFNNDEHGIKHDKGVYLSPVLMPYLSDIVLGPRSDMTTETVYADIKGKPCKLPKVNILHADYFPNSYKLKIPLSETQSIRTLPLYKRLGLRNPVKE